MLATGIGVGPASPSMQVIPRIACPCSQEKVETLRRVAFRLRLLRGFTKLHVNI